MNKSFLITFSVSVIIFATAAVIMLMLLLPKQLVSLKTSVEKYEGIEKSNYTYTKTKDISKEALLKEYKISSDDISKFRNEYKYIPGNSDPFYRYTGSEEGSSDAGTTNSGDSSNTVSAQEQAIQRTTNSNGGIANPESTTK